MSESPPEQVQLTVPGTTSRNATIVRPPPEKGHRRGVVVIHDATGFRRDTIRHCSNFAEQGYVAIAPDLYAGGRPGCIVRVLQSMRTHRGEAYDVIEAARAHLAADPDVDAHRIGVIGFCMGGGFALVAAADQAFAVAAPFYGSVPGRAARLRGVCPVIAQYGDKDTAFAPHVRRLTAHLSVLDVPHEIVVHEGVGHSFMNDHPDVLYRLGRYVPPLYAGHDGPTEADAWARVLAFFDQHLTAA